MFTIDSSSFRQNDLCLVPDTLKLYPEGQLEHSSPPFPQHSQQLLWHSVYKCKMNDNNNIHMILKKISIPMDIVTLPMLIHRTLLANCVTFKNGFLTIVVQNRLGFFIPLKSHFSSNSFLDSWHSWQWFYTYHTDTVHHGNLLGSSIFHLCKNQSCSLWFHIVE